MLTPDGPKVLEYNVRFGDPEAEVVLPRLTSDLAELLAGAAAGQLRTEQFSSEAAVTVVAAAKDYPASPATGDAIEGLEEARAVDGVTVFCGGGRRPWAPGHRGWASVDDHRHGPEHRRRPWKRLPGAGPDHLAGHARPPRYSRAGRS